MTPNSSGVKMQFLHCKSCRNKSSCCCATPVNNIEVGQIELRHGTRVELTNLVKEVEEVENECLLF